MHASKKAEECKILQSGSFSTSDERNISIELHLNGTPCIFEKIETESQKTEFKKTVSTVLKFTAL